MEAATIQGSKHEPTGKRWLVRFADGGLAYRGVQQLAAEVEGHVLRPIIILIIIILIRITSSVWATFPIFYHAAKAVTYHAPTVMWLIMTAGS